MESHNRELARLLQAAIKNHTNGKINQARKIYNKILNVNESHPDALHNLGILLVQQQKAAEALPYLKKAIQAYPRHPQFWISYIEILLQVNHLSIAEQTLKQAQKLGLQEKIVQDLNKKLSEQKLLKSEIQNLRLLEKKGNALELENQVVDAIKRYGGIADFAQMMGVALLHQNKNSDALLWLEKAFKNNPYDLSIMNQKAIALKRLNRFDEAHDIFTKILEDNPNSIEIYSNIGDNLSTAKRYEQAIPWLEKGLAIDPEYFALRVNYANALSKVGEDKKARSILEKLVNEGNRQPETLTSYAKILTDYGHANSAISLLKETLEKKPDYRNAIHSLGVALSMDGRTNEARKIYKRILDLDPGNVKAIVALANLERDEGNFEDARKLYYQALELDSNNVSSLVGLVKSKKMTLKDSEWLKNAEKLVESELSFIEKSILYYGMGKFCDDLKDYDKAFLYFQKANEINKMFRSEYDRSNQEKVVNRMVSAYTKEKYSRGYPGSNESELPLFIVGMPRSGTSLVEQILASHSQVYGAGELYFWIKNAEKYKSNVLNGEFSSDTLKDIASKCLLDLNKKTNNASRIVDKMPGNFLWIGFIHSVFPKARILHIKRNPVDTCLSIFFQHFNSRHRYSNDLDDLAHYWVQYHKVMNHWSKVLPKDILLDVPYEKVVDDYEVWARKIISFIDLEWEEQCLEYYKTPRKVGTASNWQARQPIYTTSKARWYNYKKYAAPLLSLLNYYTDN